MTVIAWDGQFVASDSLAVAGGVFKVQRDIPKLLRRSGVVFAFSGSMQLFAPMVEWWEAGHAPADCPERGRDGGTLLVFREGRCWRCDTMLPYPEECFAPDAWGYGAEYAIGAMMAGADARSAVEISIRCCPSCGGAVVVESVDN